MEITFFLVSQAQSDFFGTLSQNSSFALEIGYFGERSERPSERQRASFPLNMRLKRLGLKKFRLRRQLFQGCALAAAFGCSIAPE